MYHTLSPNISSAFIADVIHLYLILPDIMEFPNPTLHNELATDRSCEIRIKHVKAIPVTGSGGLQGL
jgi:hypothetical protein